MSGSGSFCLFICLFFVYDFEYNRNCREIYVIDKRTAKVERIDSDTLFIQFVGSIY